MAPHIIDAVKNTCAPGQVKWFGWVGVQISLIFANAQSITMMLMNALIVNYHLKVWYDRIVAQIWVLNKARGGIFM